MAEVALTITGKTVGTLKVSTVLTPEQTALFTDYLMSTYGLADDGNPRTIAEAIQAYWTGTVRGTFANIDRWSVEAEITKARKTARMMK